MKPQRGAAALPVTVMLGLALLLAVGYANRSVMFEVRSTRNQLQAAQARDAAQAGLAWALAQLNQPGATQATCQPADGGPAFHARVRLGIVQASCVHRDHAWRCDCPASGAPAPVDTAGAPAFSVQLTPDAGRHDQWQLSSVGHGTEPGSRAVLQLRVGRLPSLDTLPAAALTVRGAARFDAGFGLHHTDPASGGVTLHSGGAVDGPALRLQSTPGTPAQASLVTHEPALAALTATGLHASVFRLSHEAWAAQPAVAHIDCRQACDTRLADAATRHQVIALTGGLQLDTPLVLGTHERPVLLVVDGPVALNAAATVHGLVYVRHAAWHDTAGASVHGAVIAEQDFDASGTTQIHHDLAVLQTLQTRAGVHAPLQRSWRDL